MSSLSSASAASYYRPMAHQPIKRQAEHEPHQQPQFKPDELLTPSHTQQGQVSYTDTLPPQTASHSQMTPFASVSQHHQQKAILMGNILQDVESTMEALGVSESVRGRVHKYMVTIEDQSAHENPSKRHIQESLKVIGNILDGFITDALKQPSNVVRDWVEALLLQPIEYHDPDIKIQKVNAQGNNPQQQAQSYQATPEQYQQWRQTIKASKSALKYGQADEAARQLLQLVGELETHGETALLANTLTGLAKAYKHTGQTAAADTALQTAAKLYNQMNEPHKSVLQWRNLAQLYIEHGQPNNALTTFKQGSEQANRLLNETSSTKYYADLLRQAATLHNDWASHLFDQKDISAAKQQLKTARQLALQPKGPKGLLPDIYSNLAHVFTAQGHGEKAERALLQSLKAAQKLGNTDSYQASWQQLQQLYAAQA